MDEVDTHTKCLQMQLCTILAYTNLIVQRRCHGGDKGTETPRVRKDIETDIFQPLGDQCLRRAYRMNKQSFYKLYWILKTELEDEFLPFINRGTGHARREKSAYYIDLKIRLSCALRFFAGADPLDLMISHGISHSSVYCSVWGVVDCINRHPQLLFKFPSHDEQREISARFQKKSGALFDCVVGAIDGMLVWTTKPTERCCEAAKCGEKHFLCSRKDKFGLNLQAICDDKLRFTWVDIRWPGSTSDYMAWMTSDLCGRLEDGDSLLLDGKCIVGDNAYVKKNYMSVPHKGIVSQYDDAYNFYVSQLRISIERAFGALVHRWAILWRPLCTATEKVGPLVMTLCRLHNYCINESEMDAEKTTREDAEFSVRYMDSILPGQLPVGGDNRLVMMENGRPTSLLHRGSHFQDAPACRRVETDVTPMDTMMAQVASMNLMRPGPANTL